MQKKHLQPFIDNQLDVLLWDPVESPRKSGSKGYASDLLCLLKKVKEDNPNRHIILKSHCATSDPAVQAAVESKGKNIHIILDRG